MSQNAQNFSGLNTHVRSLTDIDDDPLAPVDTLKILSCPICRAVYRPFSLRQEVAQTSDTLLETAFMGVCHFCFRCQRPSCPQCWNPVHQVCTSCGEEARLPFCSPVPSLEGLIFSPLAAPQTIRELHLSFACLRNGHFYFPDPVSHPEALETNPATAPASPSSPPSNELSVVRADQTAQADPASMPAYPAWVQEVLGYRPGKALSAEAASRRNNQEDSLVWRAPSDSIVVPPQTNQGVDWSQMTRMQLPALVADEQEREPEKQEEADNETIPLFERIENALILGIAALLLITGLVIVLAMSSASVNAFFFHVLHIDIRTEVSYLLQLR